MSCGSPPDIENDFGFHELSDRHRNRRDAGVIFYSIDEAILHIPGSVPGWDYEFIER